MEAYLGHDELGTCLKGILLDWNDHSAKFVYLRRCHMGIGDVLEEKDRLERHCMISSDGGTWGPSCMSTKEWLT